MVEHATSSVPGTGRPVTESRTVTSSRQAGARIMSTLRSSFLPTTTKASPRAASPRNAVTR